MLNELSDRLFNFSVRVIKLLQEIKYNEINRVIIYQLTKSATSSGANYEESQAASSKSDFTNKVNISLKEMRESNYWLRIIKEVEIAPIGETEALIDESIELMKILGKIVSKSRINPK